ncbi:MAG TPA: lipocalin family protein [Caulobacterales bacterium]|nr:lipocalin family protein [Caulobacterales bacterium]
MKPIFLAAAVFASGVAHAAPPVNRSAEPPLTVTPIDINRYAGLWYEIARFENGFEKNCAGVTARYAPRKDGKVDVLNTCRQDTPQGKVRTAKGVARIVDRATNAKLKVSFFWPFEGDYWVLDRAADYAWALVGEPGGRYLWILARSPKIDAGLKADLVGRLKARGYNIEALHWTAQHG